MIRKPYRKGKAHVKREMCATCIFRPGNLMSLREGRVDHMVEEAKRDQSAIVCHETLDGAQAVCHGFYKLHATAPLQVAERLGRIKFVP